MHNLFKMYIKITAKCLDYFMHSQTILSFPIFDATIFQAALFEWSYCRIAKIYPTCILNQPAK